MSIYPCLSYRDGRAAIDFLQRAFGFEADQVHEGDGGRIVHAELRLGGGRIMFGDHEASAQRWGDHTGQGWTYVALPDADIDALCARARDAGAEIVMEPADQDYGSRDFAARDPEGNLWSFGTYAPQ